MVLPEAGSTAEAVKDAHEDGSVFLISGGKTENAKRIVPVPDVARPIVARLRADAIAGGHERLFHAFPMNRSKGNASPASSAFTTLGRKVPGVESNGHLTFRSLRHTWKTASRRAGPSIDDAHDLGGWAGIEPSSDPYDHGFSLADLAAAQAKVAALLERDGYLNGLRETSRIAVD